ncbi:MAG: HYR domain-containing protein [Bacteroidetes bacterium]|nr:HYR domain-containing protein [Bacteroidota bacterium]
MRATLWAFALLLIGTTGGVQASHYAGTDIIVDWLGGENYRFTQKVYRDCAGITLGTTTLVNLTPAIPVSGVTLTRSSLIDITPLCPGQLSRCASASGAFGIEEHIYIGVVSNLAPNTNYRVDANQLCCRNAAITTVTNAGSQQLYIYSNFRTGIQNSSPRFLNRPFGVFCANQAATLSPNGFDPDGDAIVYSIQSCYDLNASDPVTYAPGFSGLNPLNSSTGVSINPNTGTLSFTPTVVNQVAVICVRADEYRNGVVIGSVVRDIQVRILNCSNAAPVVAPIANVVVPVGQLYCTPVSATDANNNMITLTATSGIIPPATFVVNSSVAGSATGTFCFTPTLANAGNTYSVTINAQDNGCPSVATGTYTFNITVPIPCNMTATGSGTPATCGASNGSATVSVANGTAPISYSWTGPSGYSSFSQSISGLAAGTYNVLVVDGNSCVANATVVVGTNGSSLVTTGTTTPASCSQNNGTLTVSVTGGAAPYQYSVDGGSFGPSNTFTGLSQGIHTFSVLDANGCPASGSATVLRAADLTPPTITCPANITVGNASGVCGATVSFNGASATDDCGSASVVQTSGGASGSVFGIGTSTVSFTAVDGSGNTAACSFTVTVNDTEAPSVVCPANISVSNDPGQCGAAVSFAATGADNCPGVSVAQTGGAASGSLFPVGSSTVSFGATDAAGNTAACSFTVNVTDAEAPSVTCPANINLANDAGLCAAVASFTASGSDNCPGVSVTQIAGAASGSAFAVGTTTVTFRAVDAAGNAASCSFTVTVTDTEAPNLSCGDAGGLISRANGSRSLNSASFANDVTLPTDNGVCGAMYEYENGANDNCGIVTVAQTAGLSSGSTFPVGVTTNTFVATDASGNTTSCSFVVTVLDTETPVVTCPSNITVSNDLGQCSAAVGYSATASDNCPGVTVALSPASGSVFAVGTSSVTATATDASGNAATCSFTVTVNDTEAPSITCSANLTVSNDNGVCGAAVNYAVSSSDNCAGSSVAQGSGLASGSVFPVGTTTNTFVATDAAGNTAACSFTVTVNDTEAPVVTCPANVNVSNDNGVCGAAVSYAVSSSDNCAGSSVAQGSGLASGSVFPVGTTTNGFVATDAAGNTAACSFTVTVNDTEAPSITCPANVTVSNDNGVCGAAVSYAVSSSDNCAGSSVAQGSGLASGSVFPVGTTTNGFVATDAAGNTAACSFTVTVNDTEAPSITCPANVNVSNDNGVCGAAVSYAVSSSDNCAGSSVAQGAGLASGSVFPVGTTTNSFVATDASGNTAAASRANEPSPCTARQRDVSNDNVRRCRQLRLLDNAQHPPPPARCGTTSNGFVATDAAGNTAACSFTVTVNDTEAPSITCPANVTVSCVAAIPAANTGAVGASDNCGVAGIVHVGDVATGTGCAGNARVVIRTYRATDIYGNSATCTQTLTAEATPWSLLLATMSSCSQLMLTPHALRSASPALADVLLTLMLGAMVLRLQARAFAQRFLPRTT